MAKTRYIPGRGTDPYAEGHQAAAGGQPDTDNPYQPDTEPADLWAAGWADARDENRKD